MRALVMLVLIAWITLASSGRTTGQDADADTAGPRAGEGADRDQPGQPADEEGAADGQGSDAGGGGGVSNFFVCFLLGCVGALLGQLIRIAPALQDFEKAPTNWKWFLLGATIYVVIGGLCSGLHYPLRLTPLALGEIGLIAPMTLTAIINKATSPSSVVGEGGEGAGGGEAPPPEDQEGKELATRPGAKRPEATSAGHSSEAEERVATERARLWRKQLLRDAFG